MSESDNKKEACFLCGSSDVVWGNVTAGSRHQVKFHPDGPWLTLLSTDEQIRARKCGSCGNVQLYAEPA